MQNYLLYRRSIVAGLLLSVCLASMDNASVATAIGSIVSELGGIENLSWIISAYMVAEVAVMPIFGKLSDRYGRKRFFILGISLFLIGSLLSGLAQDIYQLSIFRAIQGIGAGALVPVASVIAFDIYPAKERGKIAGIFGVVYGISSISGPLIAAFITEYVGWRWIFYINVPLGVLALFIIIVVFKETVKTTNSEGPVDWKGIITLFPVVVCIMLILELGGQEYAWLSAPVIALLICGFSTLVLFLFVEKMAKEPVFPFAFLKKRLFTLSILGTFLYGAIAVIPMVYIPLFIQGVLGRDVTDSGIALIPLMLGTVIGNQIGGSMTKKFPYKIIMIFSHLFFLVALLLLGSISTETPFAILIMYVFMLGLGLGVSYPVLGLAAIHYFGTTARGTANSTVTFMRSLGMTIGISFFGFVQSTLYKNFIRRINADENLASQIQENPQIIFSGSQGLEVSRRIFDEIQNAFSMSISTTFTVLMLNTGSKEEKML